MGEITALDQQTSQMQFSNSPAVSTAPDSLSSTYSGIGGQSMLFDIMQTKLSDNVQPVTSQHIAIGQHCIDMLMKKDGVQAHSPPTRRPT